ncbi:hypothetical protein ALQ53_103842 [Pseudomonas cannabina]|uniref:Uncharacterized protein n=1 Tax=Pseudomonas cannabina TaxID=86840 RepID=A0AB37Q8B7_PSECA|nr:Unknown protein sequence [Pseudomonas syringae pv. maculicola]RMN80406.1 hypothetical protein ALQ53_103842 [Pseudomonas cannabina]
MLFPIVSPKQRTDFSRVLMRACFLTSLKPLDQRFRRFDNNLARLAKR